MRLPSCQAEKNPRCAGAAQPFPASEHVIPHLIGELRMGLVAGLSVLALVLPSGSPPHANAISTGTGTAALPSAPVRLADWGDTPVSDQVKNMALWSAVTQDHAAMPFVIIDKRAARLYVFDASAHLQAHTAVLLGSAIGDHTVPGIGEKAIADVLPEERTTPAGRFNGRIGRNLSGEEVVWVDYDAAVSMHRVRPNVASERRLERLASETSEDNRISYGCINVPVDFFETHILPVFSSTSATIYVLPDQLALDEVFSAAP
ncbi:hypothetical protein J2W49_000464 [Hydrogenophaga palleronii]|uniref:L,D-transpeptidase n=1 Tax=Hydrogenophaga palleronii TaxID=65655 RepID=A0ABU1WGY9_9BURK|nr:hypothetical protein [Hydrogenophaga palleronii]MDR7148536.1 hypothetical protein [Hydrogenophaga palleronii]